MIQRQIDGGEINIENKYRDGTGYPGLDVILWGTGPTRVRLKMTGTFALELAAALVRRVVEGQRMSWRGPGLLNEDPGKFIKRPAQTKPEGT